MVWRPNYGCNQHLFCTKHYEGGALPKEFGITKLTPQECVVGDVCCGLDTYCTTERDMSLQRNSALDHSFKIII